MNYRQQSLLHAPTLRIAFLITVAMVFLSARTAEAQVSGSGTINKIPKWTATTALGDSTIFDNGFVGIGTTNPGSKLEVAGNSMLRAAGPTAFLYDTGGTVNARQFYFWNSGGKLIGRWVNDNNSVLVAESITFLNNGNVGLGTTSPVFKLDVLGNSRISGSNAQLQIDGIKAGGNSWLLQTVDADGRYRIYDNTSFVERISVLQTGNVGIGTAQPSKLLQTFVTHPLRRCSPAHVSPRR